jgi:hypothetical protein
MVTAGDDPHIKGVFLVVPFTSGTLDARGLGKNLIGGLWKNREAQIIKSESGV